MNQLPQIILQDPRLSRFDPMRGLPEPARAACESARRAGYTGFALEFANPAADLRAVSAALCDLPFKFRLLMLGDPLPAPDFRAVVRDAMELAAAIDCPRVAVTGSVSDSPSLADRRLVATQHLGDLHYDAQRRGVELALSISGLCASPLEAREFFDSINSPWIGAMLDLRHLQGDVCDFIESLTHRLRLLVCGPNLPDLGPQIADAVLRTRYEGQIVLQSGGVDPPDHATALACFVAPAAQEPGC